MSAGSKQNLIDSLRASISNERLATYLTAAGFDADRALSMYLWNANIGEAFHLPIQAVEVGLRNAVNRALCAAFGPNWWRDKRFVSMSDATRKANIDIASRRIINKGYTLTTSQIVATLSFGFWVAMMQPRYNPSIWSKQLRQAFPNLPADKNRAGIAASARRVADLRNRIWHHEPIFRMDLTEEFRVAMQLLRWICPAKEAWVRPHCRVLGLMRQKP